MQENSTIRKGLKEMNEYLSKFIDYIKDQKLIKTHSMGYKYGNNGKLKKSKEEKIEKLTAESDNYQRMIENLTDEHTKLKTKVELVTDPKYVVAIRQDVSDTKDYINELQK
jgi:esterase/lipase